jgi:hypothetical protein
MKVEFTHYGSSFDKNESKLIHFAMIEVTIGKHSAVYRTDEDNMFQFEACCLDSLHMTDFFKSFRFFIHDYITKERNAQIKNMIRKKYEDDAPSYFSLSAYSFDAKRNDVDDPY